MTTITANRAASHAPARTGVAGNLAALWTRLVAWRNREAAIAATFAELNGLTDRELSDIGFHRADLRRIAREAHQD